MSHVLGLSSAIEMVVGQRTGQLSAIEIDLMLELRMTGQGSSAAAAQPFKSVCWDMIKPKHWRAIANPITFEVLSEGVRGRLLECRSFALLCWLDE